MAARRLTIFLITKSVSLASCSSISERLSVDVPVGATDIVSLVTDTKGLDDRSFNDTVWMGVTDAKEEKAIATSFSNQALLRIMATIDNDRYHPSAPILPGVTKDLDSRVSPKEVLKWR